MIKWGILVWCALIASGCAANFHEAHYYKITDQNNRFANYMKFEVRGHSQFSNAKYASGYYDQAALDRFFNSVIVTPAKTKRAIPKPDPKPEVNKKGDGEASGAADTTADAESESLVLTPVGNDGVLTLVMSTNASEILKTIGAFAENELVAKALTNLVNRNTIIGASETKVELEDTAALSTALKAELTALLQAILSNPTAEQTEAALMKILSALSRASGGPGSIGGFDEASAWIATIKD